MLEKTKGRAGVFVGNAGFQLIEAIDRGAVGCMPGCSMYDVYLKIYQEYRQGNREQAIQRHGRLLGILNHIRQNEEQIVAFEKRILRLRGIIKSDYCRHPTFVSDPYYDKLFGHFYNQMAEEYMWNGYE